VGRSQRQTARNPTTVHTARHLLPLQPRMTALSPSARHRCCCCSSCRTQLQPCSAPLQPAHLHDATAACPSAPAPRWQVVGFADAVQQRLLICCEPGLAWLQHAVAPRHLPVKKGGLQTVCKERKLREAPPRAAARGGTTSPAWQKEAGQSVRLQETGLGLICSSIGRSMRHASFGGPLSDESPVGTACISQWRPILLTMMMRPPGAHTRASSRTNCRLSAKKVGRQNESDSTALPNARRPKGIGEWETCWTHKPQVDKEG